MQGKSLNGRVSGCCSGLYTFYMFVQRNKKVLMSVFFSVYLNAPCCVKQKIKVSTAEADISD